MKIPTIFQKKKNVVSIKTEKTFSSQQNTELNKILKLRKCSILGNNKARLEKDFHVLLWIKYGFRKFTKQSFYNILSSFRDQLLYCWYLKLTKSFMVSKLYELVFGAWNPFGCLSLSFSCSPSPLWLWGVSSKSHLVLDSFQKVKFKARSYIIHYIPPYTSYILAKQAKDAK